MNRSPRAILGLVFFLSLSLNAVTAPRAVPSVALPLTFVPNHGQAQPGVKYVAQLPGSAILLTSRAAVLRLESCAGPVSVRLVGAGEPQVQPLEPLGSTSSYFLGSDPRAWRPAIPNYGRIRYRQAFPGVDVDFYGRQNRLEFDFIVAPGADTRRIELAFDGVEQVEVEAGGDLALRCGSATTRLLRPHVYQQVQGREKPVRGEYVRRGSRRVGFQLGPFDVSAPLVLDPVLSYSSYLGGSQDDTGWSVASDLAGNLYIAGRTTSTNFPMAAPVQGAKSGSADIFVMKLNPAGTGVMYSTYLGGSSDEGISVGALASDASGNVYLAGWTQSANFPTTSGAAQPTFGGGSVDAFLTKLNPSGSALVYSTFFGGQKDEEALGVAVDSSGAAYIVGDTNSPNFFVSADAFQKTLGGGSCGPWNSTYTCPDAFVAKFSATGAVQYSTLLGGGNAEQGHAIAVDAAGNAVIAGSTASSKFPTTPGALQTTSGGGTCVDVVSGGGSITIYSRACNDGFVARLNPTGSALLYSTYLGGAGNDDVALELALGVDGSTFVVGYTSSSSFPVSSGALQSTLAGSRDAFVTKLDAPGAIVYSTYLGGSGSEEAHALALDPWGNAYVAGRTSSTDFPLANPLQSAYGGGALDAFLAMLDPAGAALQFSTTLGGTGDDRAEGLVLDAAGNMVLIGFCDSTNFPITDGSYQASPKGGMEAFVAKITPGVATPFNPTPTVAALLPATVTPGSAAWTLTLMGTGFMPGSVVRWKGADRPTTYFSSALLQATISAADVAAAGSMDVTVFTPAPRGGTSKASTLSVAAPTNTGGMVNGAHYGPKISLGTIVSLFGTNLASSTAAASGLPLPTTLGNTKVTMGGKDMPLFYASPGQINAQVPFELYTGPTQFIVNAGGTARTAVSVNIGYTSPALFTTTQDGKGPAAVLGPQGVVSAASPTARGEVVSLFVTGLGGVTPAVKSGEAAPSSPLSNVINSVTVTVGGVPGSVLFAGLAPGFAGLYQVNVRIPAAAPLGDNVPLIIQGGGEYSNVATIAVR